MNRFILCILLALVGVSCQQSVNSITKVDKTFLKEEVLGKDVQLVDVRTPEEYEAGHIQGAVNYNIINSEAFLGQIKALDKDQPVYLYCKMGGRSDRAANLLKEQGFSKIFDYSGGYNDWVTD